MYVNCYGNCGFLLIPSFSKYTNCIITLTKLTKFVFPQFIRGPSQVYEATPYVHGILKQHSRVRATIYGTLETTNEKNKLKASVADVIFSKTHLMHTPRFKGGCYKERKRKISQRTLRTGNDLIILYLDLVFPLKTSYDNLD